LELKHARMRESPFIFLRGTHYRWAQLFPLALPELAKARKVLAVGDLHVENFGSWRDEEGRLCWGVNDFDDAAELPFPWDLVRLATSAVLAATGGIALGKTSVAEQLLAGYQASIKAGGAPCVIGERWPELGGLLAAVRPKADLFWRKIQALRPPRKDVP